MSCNIDHLYYCCYGDDDYDDDDGDGGGPWTKRNDVCVVRNYYCGLVMWNAHVSEICLCDENDDSLSYTKVIMILTLLRANHLVCCLVLS